MEKTRQILFCLLIVSAAAMSAETASQSPTQLFQQALYAEQTAGDLDKAIKLYQKVVQDAAEVEKLAARATFQLGMCYLKKGEEGKAAEYFKKVVKQYHAQKELAEKASKQLEKLQPKTKDSVFAEVDMQVLKFISEQFGKIAVEANQQHLDVNSHIYYADPNGFLYSGGVNSYYNWTGKTINQKVSFGGTSYPNQTLYGVDGRELNTEIIPDKTRPNHWQIYWIPDEPLAPEESLYYGWSQNNKKKLAKMPGGAYSLTMQNQYGSPAIETFFLVLPKDMKISQGNPPTGSEKLLSFDVYWWSKQVGQGENHVEPVQLVKVGETYIRSLIKSLYEQESPRFKSLNELIKIGAAAVEPLVEELRKSNNWQVAKALGAIKDARAVGPLIEKWAACDWSPMKEVIAEALGLITEKDFGVDLQKWQQWWQDNSAWFSPDNTIQNFMSAAMNLNADKAMKYVAPDSHDYQDIKEIFENPEHPFNSMLKKSDTSVPVKIAEAKIEGNMCSAVWRVTLKEEFTIEGKTFKAGDTFELDGNLCKYGDKWLITGI